MLAFPLLKSMPSSLIPEKQLSVSPSLAATIGLEEAVMLQGLHERMRFTKALLVDGYKWYNFTKAELDESFPFWQAGDVQRISNSLKEKGIFLLGTESYLVTRVLKLALNEKIISAVEQHLPSQPAPARPAAVPKGASVIASDWRPGTEILKQLKQQGIPDSFAEESLPEFVRYWRDRNEAHHGWDSKYQKWVVRRWREEETVFAAKQRRSSLPDEWYPSEDAFEILERAGVSRSFCEDAIPEFILYWREKGESSNTWNSKFVQHVRHQWARVSNALMYDTEPRVIPQQWQPSADVYDVLRMANIDIPFAEKLVPEFVLFWRENKQMHTSWNSKFLQHVKYHWAKRHQLAVKGNKDAVGFIERHTDRSWADKL